MENTSPHSRLFSTPDPALKSKTGLQNNTAVDKSTDNLQTVLKLDAGLKLLVVPIDKTLCSRKDSLDLTSVKDLNDSRIPIESISASAEQNIADAEKQIPERSAEKEEMPECSSMASGSISAEDYAICKKCGKRVLAWELPEHNDFHFAQELQHNMNKKVKAESQSSTYPPKKRLKGHSTSIRDFFKTK